MVSFTGLSPKQAQAVEVLNNHISLPDVEVAVAQSDHASISTVNLINSTVPYLCSQQL